MPNVICIACGRVIEKPSPRQELHGECARLRDNRASCERNRTTTRGNRPGEVVAKTATPRPKRKTSLNYGDLMHAPPDQLARFVNDITAGDRSVTG